MFGSFDHTQILEELIGHSPSSLRSMATKSEEAKRLAQQVSRLVILRKRRPDLGYIIRAYFLLVLIPAGRAQKAWERWIHFSQADWFTTAIRQRLEAGDVIVVNWRLSLSSIRSVVVVVLMDD